MKIKSHSGLSKRVKVTGGGKIMALGSGKERKLKKKSVSRKNVLKNFREVSPHKVKKLKKMLNI